MSNREALYCDGGLLSPNPSALGGTWAFRLVDATDKVVKEQSGFILPADLKTVAVTNNHTELLAAVLALRAAPENWEGTLWTDSDVTLKRLRRWQKGKIKRHESVPPQLLQLTLGVLRRIGRQVRFLQIAGHPTRVELTVGQRGAMPVSKHNCWCDCECQRLAEEWKREMALPQSHYPRG